MPNIRIYQLFQDLVYSDRLSLDSLLELKNKLIREHNAFTMQEYDSFDLSKVKIPQENLIRMRHAEVTLELRKYYRRFLFFQKIGREPDESFKRGYVSITNEKKKLDIFVEHFNQQYGLQDDLSGGHQ